MASTKTQFNVRMSPEAVAAAKNAAEADRITLNQYIERLVLADTNPRRAASLEYVGKFLDEWSDFIESEDARAHRG